MHLTTFSPYRSNSKYFHVSKSCRKEFGLLLFSIKVYLKVKTKIKKKRELEKLEKIDSFLYSTFFLAMESNCVPLEIIAQLECARQTVSLWL